MPADELAALLLAVILVVMLLFWKTPELTNFATITPHAKAERVASLPAENTVRLRTLQKSP